MLLNDFFTIGDLIVENQTVRAVLTLNAAHDIFRGHFPVQPVVPGVCMIQMLSETLETVLRREIRLASADQIKFLSMIDPRKTNSVQVEMDYVFISAQLLDVRASIQDEGRICLKLKARFATDATASSGPIS